MLTRDTGRRAEHADLAAARLDEVRDDAQERRLPAARRTEEREELPGRDVKTQAFDRGNARRSVKKRTLILRQLIDRLASCSAPTDEPDPSARGGFIVAACMDYTLRREERVALRTSIVITSSTFG